MCETEANLRWLRREEHTRPRCTIANILATLSVFSLRLEKPLPARHPPRPGYTPPTTDRRVARTRKLLHDALHSLLRERDYDSITVTQILERANVGRSAFYMHFQSKDELLTSGVHAMLGAIPPQMPTRASAAGERLLWFSRPIFEHIAGLRQSGQRMLGHRGRTILHARVQQILADLLRDPLERECRKRRHPLPPDLLANYLAGSFVLILNWWIDSGSPLAPVEVDRIFAALVQPALTPTP